MSISDDNRASFDALAAAEQVRQAKRRRFLTRIGAAAAAVALAGGGAFAGHLVPVRSVEVRTETVEVPVPIQVAVPIPEGDLLHQVRDMLLADCAPVIEFALAQPGEKASLEDATEAFVGQLRALDSVVIGSSVGRVKPGRIAALPEGGWLGIVIHCA